jgi:hypothetical protein
MLSNVPTAINQLSRNVVINHPNSYNAVMIRKRVTRTSPTSIGGAPTMGGMMVLNSEDEEKIEWDLLGNAYSLQAEMFTPGNMMDRQDANNGGIDEFRFLIEPETLLGNGTGAILTPVVTNGVVTGITIVNAGMGYLTGQALAFAGVGSGAAATIIAVDGAITGITITSGGTGYTSAPTASVLPRGFKVKKNDVMYLVLGESIRLAFEIVAVETVNNISPYSERFVCNRRDDLHLAV